MLDRDTLLSIVKVRSFAELPENHYRPRPDATPPGDDPRYVVHILFGFRAVFTVTEWEGKTMRHLSMSLLMRAGRKPHSYPNPIAVETVAKVFGFTGDVRDWQIGEDGHGAVVVLQPL